MPVSALALVILAGLIHACWNIIAKQVGGDSRFAFFTSIALALIWAPLGLPLAYLDVPGWGWVEWAVIFASGFVHVAYYLILLRGYRMADLTVVYPAACIRSRHRSVPTGRRCWPGCWSGPACRGR